MFNILPRIECKIANSKLLILKPSVVKDKFRNMTNIPNTKESESLKSTLNQEEHDKFKKMAHDWWDPKGPAQGLLSMNQLRVPLIKDGLISSKYDVFVKIKIIAATMDKCYQHIHFFRLLID